MMTNAGTTAQEALYALAEGKQACTLDDLTDARWIREQAERVVAHHVEDLRAQGTSWAAIGTALGVSAQAAHKRYA